MAAPLSGFKVVSLTHFLQGPSCVQFLADLGADVVKIERVGGAHERRWSGAKSRLKDGTSVFYALAGRNQRCIELNIQSENGRAALWRLIEQADVLVENFRPGVLEKYGFGYEQARARNARLVYCSLSGYGPVGPSAEKPGQDLLLQSLSGLMTLSGRAGDAPIPVGTAVVDQHAATLGALGVLAALVKRSTTGHGSRVDSNLLSAALDLQLEPLNYTLNNAKLWDRSAAGVASRFHDAPYGVFKTADGWLTMSMSDGPTLAKAFNDPAFADLKRDDQFDQREFVTERVAGHMIKKTIAEWEEHLGKFGMWIARIRNYEEVLSDPQLKANQSIYRYEDPSAGDVKLLAHPILYDGKVPELRIPPPAVGQHTDEVLRELGYSRTEIEELRRADAIGPDRAIHPIVPLAND